ncbi:MAG: hypothetical protein AB7T86_02710 [Xanthobacteraceae bacterium]|uniref:hypothetical protein n=1 Tax=Pseudolabrys sp. TaxID=1960880 RepID=UPI003D0D580C
MRQLIYGTLGIAFSFIVATAAVAQQGGRIRGQIAQASGDGFVVKTREGATVTAKIDDKTRVGALVKASLADIKTDSFIGIAGMPAADGRIVAFSIHIFMPAQRGVVPDRHGPWDARPNSTMTNAYVGSAAKSADGEVLTVKYKDGEKQVIVTPETVIAAAAPGSKDELKAGAGVVIFGYEKQGDGAVLVRSMYVGRGVTPAM